MQNESEPKFTNENNKDLDSKKESLSNKKRKKIIVSLVATALLTTGTIFGAVACSSNEKQTSQDYVANPNQTESNANSIDTSSDYPDTSVDATETQTDTANTATDESTEIADSNNKSEVNGQQTSTEVFKTNMEKYDAMDVETFNKLPQNERLVYADYLIEESNDFYTFKYITEDDPDGILAIEPVKASIDNTGQEILDTILWKKQHVYLQIEKGSESGLNAGGTIAYELEKTKANKLLSGIYSSVSGKVSNAYNISVKGIDDQFGTIKMINTLTEINTSDLIESVDANGSVTKSKIISYEDQDGIIWNLQADYVEYTNDDGEKSSTWLLDVQSQTANPSDGYSN